MKIACVLGPQFEDSEFKKPYEEFKKAGHEVTIIGIEAGKTLQGDKGKVETKSEKAITEVKPEQFDALLIPGGHSPDKLRADDRMVEFVQKMFDAKSLSSRSAMDRNCCLPLTVTRVIRSRLGKRFSVI